jgi:DNA-binding NarL/FixJ family response regulator
MYTHSASDPIRVVVVDDHLVVRAGLRALLRSVPDIRVVGEAANGQEALELIDRLHPDVAVLDLDMPVMDGLTALKTLIAAESTTRVLILTLHDDVEHLATLLDAGAAGYLVKTAADRELVDAIRAVGGGETYLQPRAAAGLASRLARQARHHAERLQYQTLSERERDVLVLVAAGHSASDIGQRLVISPKTVESYKQRVSEKLGLHHRPDYVRFCLNLDLLHANS